MATMGGDHQAEKKVAKGCIKKKKGPWVVHRTTKDGRVTTRHRWPSDRERLRNMERERNRRVVTGKIFAGLRAFGNYQLPKKADTIELLKAVCEEAGWHVEEDGTVYKKDGGYCSCDGNSETIKSRSKMAQNDNDINVTLSLTL